MNAATCFLVEPVQDNDRHRWRRVDTGEEFDYRDLPPGAMWDAHWMPTAKRSIDGRCLVVKLPNGQEWVIDSQASNCDRRGEAHDCWCRHGEPPHVTVDKLPEPGRSTCSAGAGSVGSGRGDQHWHGFLRNGELMPV